MTPKLSIITINRNNAEGLRKTIESVVTQTGLKDGELDYIIIDGASTDHSVEVIKEFVNHQEYGKYISYWVSEPDTGIYNAMNKGIKKATGTLVGIMNSGDTFFPKVFKQILDYHLNEPHNILYGAVKKVFNNEFHGVLAENWDYLKKSMIPHNATFVPIEYYNQFGLYNESFKVLADYERFSLFYSVGLPNTFIDMIVCNYELGGISMTSKLVDVEKQQIHQKYGFYIPKTKKEQIKDIIRKILRW
jgi:glycosyltransferase involved in cell wall biosynthesis